MKLSNIIWLMLFVAMIAAIVIGFQRGRRFAIERYGSETAQENWDSWRSDVKEMDQEKNSPTERRVPKSPRPPMLVLMDDYYLSCMLFSIVLSSALFLTTMFVAKGAMKPTVIRED